MTDTITCISSMAMRQILTDVAALYRKRSRRMVEIVAMGGVDAAKMVRAGTSADVLVLASPVMEELETEGYLVKGSRQVVALSSVAIAVRAGGTKPAIDNEASVKQAMLVAGKVGYSTGPSGEHLKRLWSNWGIRDTMARKAVQAPAGMPVAELLARGDVDLGFQQMSELLTFDGVDVVGFLPPDIQSTTMFTAGIIQSSLNVDLARDIITLLVSPETGALKRRYGMDAPA